MANESSTRPEDAEPEDGAPGDVELLDLMRRGDASAFGIFYARHRGWIVALARAFTGNHDDALDVLQETFVYILRKLPTLELRARARTFLYPVVKHLALDGKRRSRRQSSLEASHDLPAKTEPVADNLLETDVGSLLRQLPEDQVEVVWLRFVDGLDLKSIAGLLGIPLGTVKSRLHAALEALRERMR